MDLKNLKTVLSHISKGSKASNLLENDLRNGGAFHSFMLDFHRQIERDFDEIEISMFTALILENVPEHLLKRPKSSFINNDRYGIIAITEKRLLVKLHKIKDPTEKWEAMCAFIYEQVISIYNIFSTFRPIEDKISIFFHSKNKKKNKKKEQTVNQFKDIDPNEIIEEELKESNLDRFEKMKEEILISKKASQQTKIIEKVKPKLKIEITPKKESELINLIEDFSNQIENVVRDKRTKTHHLIKPPQSIINLFDLLFLKSDHVIEFGVNNIVFTHFLYEFECLFTTDYIKYLLENELIKGKNGKLFNIKMYKENLEKNSTNQLEQEAILQFKKNVAKLLT